MNRSNDLLVFFDEQLSQWPQVAERYNALRNIKVKDIVVDDFTVRLQFNPARALSATAKVDEASIAARPCFLCAKNRPSQQIVYDGFEGFDTLVNPYPIFPIHFTLASKTHVHQDSADFIRMGEIANSLPGFVVFFNGSCAGASAPDHLHFQVGNCDFLLLCNSLEDTPGCIMKSTPEYKVYKPDFLPVHALHFISKEINSELSDWLHLIVPDNSDTLSSLQGMKNVLMWRGNDGLLHTVLFPRAKHRPDCYYMENGLLVSPGAIDMAGVIILPDESDFNKITKTDIRNIYDEVSMQYMDQPRFQKMMLL